MSALGTPVSEASSARAPAASRHAGQGPWLARQASRWVAFWDEREPPTCLALIRVALAAVVLADLAAIAAHGAAGWLWAPAEAGGLASWDPAAPPSFQSLFQGVFPGALPSMAGSAQALWGCLVVSALCVGAGCFTRAAALAHVFFSVQAALINGPADRAIDRLVRIVLLILVLSPAGRVWSVDAKLATGSFRGDAAPAPAWARRLILGQLVLTYFAAGLAKGGTHWYPWGGYQALYLTLQDPILSVVAGARWLERPVVYLATQAGTAVTHLWELAAPLVLVAAWYRRTEGKLGRSSSALGRLPVRTAYVIIGVIFHLSLALLLRLGIFPFAMLACYPAFFHPRELRVPAERRRATAGVR